MNNGILILALVTTFLISCTKNQITNPSTPTPTPRPTPPTPSRPQVEARLISVGALSQARTDLAVGSVGNKIFFAGGMISPQLYSSRVDIYNVETNSWSTAELSHARSNIAVAVTNKKIFFAGGYTMANRNGFSSRVDIYNTETNTWTTADLGNVEAPMSGASAGGTVVFLTGATAHIYGERTNTWTTAQLPEKPGEGYCCQGGVSGISATAIGDNIYFAGGVGWDIHNAIDIYNIATNQWSASTLSKYKGYAASIAVNNVNYWAGGVGDRSLSSEVEMRDMTTGTSSVGNLFQGNANFSAVEKNDTIVFFTGRGAVKNKFDIYDIRKNTWLIGLLPENIEDAAIISHSNLLSHINAIYVAGGKVNGDLSNEVRKLEF